MGEQRDRQDIATKRISRRRLLAGTGVGAVGLLLAAACGKKPGGCPPNNVSQIPAKTSDDDPVHLVFHESLAAPAGSAFAADVNGILLHNVHDPWTIPYRVDDPRAIPALVHLQLPAVDAYICRSGEATRQDAQAVKPIDWRSRYHVRLWNYVGAVPAIGSAHAEEVSLHFHHNVTSFDAGKREVALALRGEQWTVQEDSMQMGQGSPPKDNGWATELTRPN